MGTAPGSCSSRRRPASPASDAAGSGGPLIVGAPVTSNTASNGFLLGIDITIGASWSSTARSAVGSWRARASAAATDSADDRTMTLTIARTGFAIVLGLVAGVVSVGAALVAYWWSH